MSAKPKSHHLDKHAHRIAAAAPGDATTCSPRRRWRRGFAARAVADPRPPPGYGPPFERLGPMLIRYSRRKVLAWLDERSHLSTDEYDTERWRARAA